VQLMSVFTRAYKKEVLYHIMSRLYHIMSRLYHIMSRLYHIVSRLYHIMSRLYHIMSRLYHIMSRLYHIMSRLYHIMSRFTVSFRLSSYASYFFLKFVYSLVWILNTFQTSPHRDIQDDTFYKYFLTPVIGRATKEVELSLADKYW